MHFKKATLKKIKEIFPNVNVQKLTEEDQEIIRNMFLKRHKSQKGWTYRRMKFIEEGGFARNSIIINKKNKKEEILLDVTSDWYFTLKGKSGSFNPFNYEFVR